jgi:hypothetical protein
MAITFQKRQKEMKRLEKQRAKEERRAQKKIEKRAKDQAIADGTAIETSDTDLEQPIDRDL